MREYDPKGKVEANYRLLKDSEKRTFKCDWGDCTEYASYSRHQNFDDSRYSKNPWIGFYCNQDTKTLLVLDVNEGRFIKLEGRIKQ